MSGKNRRSVTDEPVDLRKNRLEVGDFRRSNLWEVCPGKTGGQLQMNRLI
jgi:hypothetical protein